MTTELEKYKQYLDAGTQESSGIADESLSRYQSFKYCIEALKDIDAPRILELGTTRSYVDGKYPGCNEDDTKYWEPNLPERWDWGAGCFTLVMGQAFPNADLTTVDIIKSHLDRCCEMARSLGITCTLTIDDSVHFLRADDQMYNLIYVDTGDMWPIEPTANHQLQEVQAIVQHNVLAPGGLLLIDDVMNKTPREHGHASKLGKSYLAIPWLLDNGFTTVFEGYQYILKRSQ